VGEGGRRFAVARRGRVTAVGHSGSGQVTVTGIGGSMASGGVECDWAEAAQGERKIWSAAWQLGAQREE
jgi:hypothetical protein